MKHREIILIAHFAPWNESTNTGVFVWLRETDNSKRNTKKKTKKEERKETDNTSQQNNLSMLRP